ncbi:MAG: TonB-dependent receptor plug [Bryobacterales bacterium]|nr:TonB-dependent receptor plug [Bryobacterales bacterium]
MGGDRLLPRAAQNGERYSAIAVTERVLVIALLGIGPLPAQNAELSGLITDPSSLAVPGARVVVQSADTTARRAVSSNQQGEYSVPALLPGPYNITVEANGFKTVHQNDVVVEVDQRARLDFALTLGNNTETVTVQGRAPPLNTSDASVSTLIGNNFVENLPLNGRSFSSLIDLTPGVVLTPANLYEQGQFSVNGQRPDANYFLVDGVSANLGNAGNGTLLRQGGAGELPAISAFGGTNNLVSLDALEEFRIQTSTFAPEYGRTPGAQISVVTRSGTNTFHGTAFEYFRNDVLDANDWFANGNRLARPALRQNDFGGVLGGPIRKDKLFFFGSYEALRVRQPQVANTYVPSLASRQNAPAAVQPLLSAFPLPNGPDLGRGTAAFSASYSDPSTLNSYGIRIDYLPWQRVTIFGRYSDAPSRLDQRAGSYIYSNVASIQYRTQSLTLGSDQAITPWWTNELRFNYSRSRANDFRTLNNFGGAIPPADSALYPPHVSPQNSTFFFNAGSGLVFSDGKAGDNLQQQTNLTENVSRIIGAHQLKFGLDYRRLNSQAGLVPYQLQYLFNSLSNVLINMAPDAYVLSRTADVQLLFSNWSLFAQDTWTVTRALTITYGLRWEYNTAPSSPNGTLPFTVTQVDNPATMTLAPPGTPLWHPQTDDFAPRLGVAWQLLPNLVLRGGAGIFYDLGYSGVANGASAFPYVQTKTIPNTSFPLSAAQAAPALFTTASPAGFMAVVDPNHALPRTYEWNAALERTLGKADVITVTYLGAAGRRLMRQDVYNAPNPNFTAMFNVMRNGADSSYQALQVQFRHRLAHGLQTLFSYTWAHSIDNASSDVNYLNVPPGDSPSSQERGSSDYDIRQTFSGALSYNIPAPGSGIWRSVFGGWSTDSIIYVRTAAPVNVVTGLDPFGGYLSGAASVQRPSLVPGVPLWIANADVARGSEINPAAFTKPATTLQGNLGRNALRGFGATQVDVTLRRQFKLRDRLSLHARADFFNIFNHPNFGSPINYLSSPLFGQSTQMLGASLGSGGQNGGLNRLYQIGGPRSVQLALKLQF